MTVIHRMDPLPRAVAAALADRLRVMPAVLVTGARQTGKSTLAQALVRGGRRYATLDDLDDLDVLDAARRDPEVLVGGRQPVTLDEVQREPGLLKAVKRAIDKDRPDGEWRELLADDAVPAEDWRALARRGGGPRRPCSSRLRPTAPGFALRDLPH